MKIVIGSNNKAKIKAVQDIFIGDEILSYDAKSGVSPQPFSDEETRTGAINRAKQCLNFGDTLIGIGLEGGVMELGNDLFLCNWGALVTGNDETFTASGARILLPKDISIKLKSGIELGDIMDEYVERSGVRNNEGAIGIFTNERVTRKDMFSHIVALLKGQWEYAKRNSR